jgi:hypothetical protein
VFCQQNQRLAAWAEQPRMLRTCPRPKHRHASLSLEALLHFGKQLGVSPESSAVQLANTSALANLFRRAARAQSVRRAAAAPAISVASKRFLGGSRNQLYAAFFGAEREALFKFARGCVHQRVGGAPGKPAVQPNPSLRLTRYGRHCKPGLSQSNHRLSPGLQYLPPRAA